jgi:hypothetical protein
VLEVSVWPYFSRHREQDSSCVSLNFAWLFIPYSFLLYLF